MSKMSHLNGDPISNGRKSEPIKEKSKSNSDYISNKNDGGKKQNANKNMYSKNETKPCNKRDTMERKKHDNKRNTSNNSDVANAISTNENGCERSSKHIGRSGLGLRWGRNEVTIEVSSSIPTTLSTFNDGKSQISVKGSKTGKRDGGKDTGEGNSCKSNMDNSDKINAGSRKEHPSRKRAKRRSLRMKLRSEERKQKLYKCPSITALQSLLKDGKYDHLLGKASSHILNELFPPPYSPIYTLVSQEKRANSMHFVMACNVASFTFQGHGGSKKEAKLNCSRKAVEAFFGNSIRFPEVNNKNESLCSLRSSANSHINSVPIRSSPETATTPNDKGFDKEKSFDLSKWLSQEGKNAVSIVNELYPNVIFSFNTAYTHYTKPSRQYVTRVIVRTKDNKDYSAEGRGVSKRQSKLDACKVLLLSLHQLFFHPSSDAVMKLSSLDARRQRLADEIRRSIMDKFDLVMSMSTYAKRRVLAGIVMTCDEDSNESPHKVICFATGTKCISGDHLCLNGTVLNDCHAEIVARRGLLFFLYDELHKHTNGLAHSSIFVKDKGLFSLRKGVAFHMFITGPPCGDARVFSLSNCDKVNNGNLNKDEPTYSKNEERGNDGSHLFNNKPIATCTQGFLRFKVESNIGTVPLTTQTSKAQTWDGLRGGERLLTMSCSDKMLKWNVVGVQGGLLSSIVNPIYLDTVIIGAQFQHDHLERALYGRIEPNLEGASVKRPLLMASTHNEDRRLLNSKSNGFSVNWICSDENDHNVKNTTTTFEVVCASNGKRLDGKPSRLCKRRFLERYLVVRKSLFSSSSSNGTYSHFKSMSKSYLMGKRNLVNALNEANHGLWVNKPIEQDQFSVGETSGYP